MVGYDGSVETGRILDGRSASAINANLTGALDLTSARRLVENNNLGFEGTKKTGAFELSAEQARSLIEGQ
jgi:hypothetical protein